MFIVKPYFFGNTFQYEYFQGRLGFMLKKGIKAIKHVVFGMIGGIILGVTFCCLFCGKNKVKNKASRAVHSLGDLLEQVLSLFKG